MHPLRSRYPPNAGRFLLQVLSSRSELSDLAARASDFIYIAGMRSSKAMKPEYAKPFST